MSVDLLETRDGSITIEQRGPDQRVSALDLPLTRISAEVLRAILETGNIRSMSLAGTHFPTSQLIEPDLNELGNSNALRDLSINGTQLTAEELSKLAPLMGRFTSLDLCGTEFGSNAMAELDVSTGSLEQLLLGWRRTSKDHRFPPARLQFSDFKKITKISGLKELSVRGLADEAALLALTALSRLRSLDCGETEMTNPILSQLLNTLHLETLYADKCQLKDDSADFLAQSASLRRLDLSFTRIGDQIASGISEIRELRNLSLRGTLLSDTGLQLLTKLPLLETLDVSYTRVSSQGIEGLLYHSKNLRHLSIHRIPIDAPSISSFEQLESLDLTTDATSKVCAALSDISAKINLTTSWTGESVTLPSTLQSLTARGTPNDETRDQLLAHEELQELFLFGADQSTLDTLSDGHLPSLRELLAENGAIESRHFASLARLPRLEALFISANPISDAGLSALRDHRFLHTLEIRDTQISNDAIDTIVSLRHLHCLDVPNTMIDEVGIREICNAPLLQSLALDPSQIGPVSVQALSGKAGLQEIYLYGLPSMDQIDSLSELPDLKELVIIDGELGPNHAEILSKFPRLRHIRGVGVSEAFKSALMDIRTDIAINGSFWSNFSETENFNRRAVH